MDIGHDAGSLSFELAKAVLAGGYRADTISTDLHQMSLHGREILSTDVDASPAGLRLLGVEKPPWSPSRGRSE